MKLKQLLASLTACAVVFSAAASFSVFAEDSETEVPSDPTISENWTGSGTQEDPWVIIDIAGLTDLRDNVNSQISDYESKYFALGADISTDQFGTGLGFKGTTKINGVPTTDSVFKGNFDGRNHIVIFNCASNGNDSSAGFFGYASGGVIENIIFGDPTGETPTNVSVPSRGGLVGYGENLTIKNCVNYTSVSRKTTSSGYGGIAGTLIGGSIENCKNYAQINGHGGNGGIVGLATDVNISNCENRGNITPASGGAGGIVGTFKASSADKRVTMKNCNNYGEITISSAAGGIANEVQYADISNCNNYGTITANQGNAGGIIAKIMNSTLSECINNGSVTALLWEGIGGIGGNISGSSAVPTTVTNCVNNGTITSKLRWIGGCFGNFGSNCTAVHCINKGDIICTFDPETDTNFSGGIGGIAGNNGGLIYECYNEGKVTGWSGDENLTTGAVVGTLSNRLYDSYNLGECNFAGIVGTANNNASIYNCVNLAENTVYATLARRAGWMPSNSTYYNSEITYTDTTQGKGYTTEEFKNGTVLALLNGTSNQHYNDAAEVWEQGADYPVLKYFANSEPEPVVTSAEIKSATSSEVTFTVTLAEEDADSNVIVALYDAENNLIDIAIPQASDGTAAFANGDGSVKAKLFVWQSSTNFPLVKADEMLIQ
jgi:hypothetical protein